MTEGNKKENIRAEWQRSEESLRAARVLMDAHLLRDAESRLYYAIFHAAVALLLTEGIEPRSPAGVTMLLGRTFVQSGRLGPEVARTFSRIQRYRADADYGCHYMLTREAIEEDLADCVEFIGRVQEIVAEYL